MEAHSGAEVKVKKCEHGFKNLLVLFIIFNLRHEQFHLNLYNARVFINA